MAAGTIRVVRPGLQTTVQDLGRWGSQAQGIAVAGPMDPWSHRLANAMVGNPRDRATLEVALVGPELEFEDERLVATTGAPFALTVNGQAVVPGQAFVVPANACLRFGDRLNGARAYLAVEGGIDVPIAFGSRATHVPSKIGGWYGRALAAGDRLPLIARPSRRSSSVIGDEPATFEVPDDAAVVRVLPGPDLDRFEADAIEVLQSAPYVVSVDSNRMGYRLAGPALRHSRGSDLISEATALGCLQVPASGQPLLLMADRPTTGGYPRIATVISADIGIAGQAGPGDRLRFEVCTRAEAHSALADRENRLRALESDS